MPTYKYTPTDGQPNKIYIFDKLYYSGQNIETSSYLGKNLIDKLGLVFVSDDPYVSPIATQTVQTLAAGESIDLTIPELNYNLDFYIQIISDTGSVSIGFNNNPDLTKKIKVKHSGRIYQQLESRKIRIINITANEEITFSAYVTIRGQMIDPGNRGM